VAGQEAFLRTGRALNRRYLKQDTPGAGVAVAAKGTNQTRLRLKLLSCVQRRSIGNSLAVASSLNLTGRYHLNSAPENTTVSNTYLPIHAHWWMHDFDAR